jgi:hypothetical protein
MACRRSATLLLAAVALGAGGASAQAAIGNLSPTPPTPLGGPPPQTTSSPPATTSAPVTTGAATTAQLPRTGVDLPLELTAAAVLVAGGLAAGAVGRARRD